MFNDKVMDPTASTCEQIALFKQPIKSANKWEAVARSLIYLVLRIDNHPKIHKLTERLSQFSGFIELVTVLNSAITVYSNGKHGYEKSKHYGGAYHQPIAILQDDGTWFSLIPKKVGDVSIDLSWLAKEFEAKQPSKTTEHDNRTVAQSGGKPVKKRCRRSVNDMLIMDDCCHQGNSMNAMFRGEIY